MRRSKNYNMRLPQRAAHEGEANDPADIDDLTYDVELIDTELARQQLEDARLEAEKATKVALAQHTAASPLDHPDGSATDAKIGNRTVLTTTGTLQTLLTAIGNALKGISGAGTWNAAPDISLNASKARHDKTDAAHTAFIARRDNPHQVTKAQVGLGNANDTPDTAKPVSAAQAAAIKLVQDDITAHKSDTVVHITAEERLKWNNATGGITPGSTIDCGTFVDTIADVQAHNAAMHTHNDIALDGNIDASSEPPYDLATHSVDTYAHQNLILDGNK